MQQRQREKEKRREEEVKEDVAYPLYSRYLAEKGNSILPLSRNITRAKFAYLHFKSIFDTPSIDRQREMFIDVCTFNSLSIYAVTRLSAIIISTVENLSHSLSLFHAVTIFVVARRGEEEIRPCWISWQTAIKEKPAKRSSEKPDFERVQCEFPARLR